MKNVLKMNQISRLWDASCLFRQDIMEERLTCLEEKLSSIQLSLEMLPDLLSRWRHHCDRAAGDDYDGGGISGGGGYDGDTDDDEFLKDLIHILITIVIIHIHILILIIITIIILITIIIQKVSSGPTVGGGRWERRALASSSTIIIVTKIIIISTKIITITTKMVIIMGGEGSCFLKYNHYRH